MRLGNLRHFYSIWEFKLLSSTYKHLLCVDLHCIHLCNHYKPEIVIFEFQRYSLIKEEKLLKVWGAFDWEISSTFWENIGPYYRYFFHWEFGKFTLSCGCCLPPLLLPGTPGTEGSSLFTFTTTINESLISGSPCNVL